MILIIHFKHRKLVKIHIFAIINIPEIPVCHTWMRIHPILNYRRSTTVWQNHDHVRRVGQGEHTTPLHSREDKLIARRRSIVTPQVFNYHH
jgi:hypothetical protein